MGDSERETNSMSVAARIRLYQNNANKGGLQEPVTQKSATGGLNSPKESISKFSTQKNFTRLSPSSSPNLALLREDQPPKSPTPLPRPKEKNRGLSPHDDRINVVEKDGNKEHVEKPTLQKPLLPNKPAAVLRCYSPSKDLNDNCNGISSKIQSPGFVKRPLATKVSSEKLSENRRPSLDEDKKWKRISGPPSRPLPPAPSTQSKQLSVHQKGNLGSATAAQELKARHMHGAYETVDLLHEEPEEGSSDGEFVHSGDSESAAVDEDFQARGKLPNKDRKVLSRISTSRRPPPIPINNPDSHKKSLKPPPLPSRNIIPTAEDQAIYSYAAGSTDVNTHTSSLQKETSDTSYETPHVSSVRGLMLAIQNKSSANETPDSNHDATDGDDDYEEPVENAMTRLNHLKKEGTVTDTDSDSDAYCDPESIPEPLRYRVQPNVPSAPQKALPPPPSGELSEGEGSDDSGHDYEDPVLDITPSGRVLSLRRGSHPVLNPDAYLALQELDLNATYQDPAEAFASQKVPLATNQSNTGDDVCEDLADEPLYQVYAADVLSEMRRKSEKTYKGEEDMFSEYSTGSIEAGQRLLWCQLPSVRDSGVLDTVEPRERKRQEAMFEVITSEASYLKSLSVLVNHFMNEFLEKLNNPGEEKIIDKQQFHFLFGGLPTIMSISENFLHSLRGKQEEHFIISSISDLVYDYASTQFGCYVKYCSNQVYQERTLTGLVKQCQAFCDLLAKLESSPKSQGLSLQSFLMLPMQRITRLPLLMDAICHHCEPGSGEFHNTDKALNAVHKVVKACNEGARKMERIEEMYFIQQMLSFKMKPIPIVSSSRWLLRRGEVACLEGERKMRGLKSLLRGGKYFRLYLFLFNDLLLLTKMKGEESFKVIDYCSRALLRTDEENTPTGETLKQGTPGIATNKFIFSLILLENHQRKTVTYDFFAETETEKIRWIDAVKPKPSSDESSGEKIYEEWDCPQVRAIHSYQAEQPDELTLREGDVIKVLRKLPDGWYEGMQLIDGETGWFPANHTEEIHSEHTRARNLMQRYRLLNTVTLAFDNKAKR